MFNKIINFLFLIRILNVLTGMGAVYLAAKMINFDILLLDIYNVILVIGFTMAFGNIINDYQDVVTDKIAHIHRPLVIEAIQKPYIKLLLVILLVVIILLSFTLTVNTNLLLYLCILPALIFYTRYFKPIPILGNIIIALLLSSIFIFTEYYITNDFKILLFPTVLIFGLSLIREMLKDIQDYSGDRIAKITTFPVMIGKNNAINCSIICILIFGILLILPYYYSYFNINYLYSIIILIEIPLLIMVFLLLNNPSNNSFKYISYLTKCMSIVGLLMIFNLYIG